MLLQLPTEVTPSVSDASSDRTLVRLLYPNKHVCH